MPLTDDAALAVMKAQLLHIVYADFRGESVQEIAVRYKLGIMDVRAVLVSEKGQAVRQLLEQNTLDTMADLQTQYQAAAPEAFGVLVQTMRSTNAKEARAAATEILHGAGHAPVKRVAIERKHPVVEKYKDKTPEQIRRELLELVDQVVPPAPDPDEPPYTVQ